MIKTCRKINLGQHEACFRRIPMNTRSTIMDTNSFRAEHADALDTETRKLTDKRSKILGDSYRLFYRNPVHLVRGEGQY